MSSNSSTSEPSQSESTASQASTAAACTVGSSGAQSVTSGSPSSSLSRSIPSHSPSASVSEEHAVKTWDVCALPPRPPWSQREAACGGAWAGSKSKRARQWWWVWAARPEIVCWIVGPAEVTSTQVGEVVSPAPSNGTPSALTSTWSLTRARPKGDQACTETSKESVDVDRRPGAIGVARPG